MLKLESESQECRLAKPKSNKANMLNLCPKAKGHFRETCNSQNINLMSLTHKINLGIIQIIIKSLSTTLVLSSIKNILICTISIFEKLLIRNHNLASI